MQGTIGDSQFASINSKLQASAAAFLVVPHFQLDPFSTGSVKVYTTSHVQNPQPSFDAAVKTQSSRSRASAGLGDAHGSGTPGLARQLHRRVAGQHGLETDGNGVCCNVPPVSSNDVSCSVPQVSKSRSLQLSGTIKIGTQQ